MFFYFLHLSVYQYNLENPRYGIAWNVSNQQNTDNILFHDLNNDGIVDKADLTIMTKNMLASTEKAENHLIGDIDSNGKIEMDDFKIIMAQQGRKAPWRIEKTQPTNQRQ